MPDLNINMRDLQPVVNNVSGDTFLTLQGINARKCTINQMATLIDSLINPGFTDVKETSQSIFPSAATTIFSTTLLPGYYKVTGSIRTTRGSDSATAYIGFELPDGRIFVNGINEIAEEPETFDFSIAGPATYANAFVLSQASSGNSIVTFTGSLQVLEAGTFRVNCNNPSDLILIQEGSLIDLRKITQNAS